MKGKGNRKISKKGIYLLLVVIFLCVAGGVGYFLYKNNQEVAEAPKGADHSDSVPTLYLHGWSGSGSSTDSMISYAEKNSAAKKVLTVQIDGKGNIVEKGDWTKKEKNPIIQIVFKKSRKANYDVTSKWFKSAMEKLHEKYKFKKFNVVAHSMGNLTTIYYLINYGNEKNLPKLNKYVSIAGHFDGIIGRGDKANENSLKKNGEPKIKNAEYKNIEAKISKVPIEQLSVLNIYGNLKDGSNTDGSVSVVSSRSLKYLLDDRTKTYQEVEIKGKMGKHGKLRKNEKVDQKVESFLWGK